MDLKIFRELAYKLISLIMESYYVRYIKRPEKYPGLFYLLYSINQLFVNFEERSTIISTRLLLALPSTLELSATGLLSPIPCA